MESHQRDNQRPYSNEDDNWDQNQGRYRRENDFNQSRNNQGNSRNFQGNYGDDNFGRSNENQQNRSNFRDQGNDRYGNNSGNQGSQGWGGRFDDDYGNRNRQNEGFNRNQDHNRGNSNQGGFGDRSFGGRENDDQRNYGNFNRSGNQGNNNQQRDWFDRTRDEVSSWFGDDDAERRRRMDNQAKGQHKGKGPKQYQRSPERIREDVSDRLSDDSYVDASEIEIKVNGNEVVLTGTVDSKEAKRRAEDIAESVSGVANVQNHLKVGQSSQTSSTNYQANPQSASNQYKQEKEQHN